jgi:glycosyltransferase involved in cell wall biosynthesis
MFGWEFAPMMSGGLGVACAGLTQGLVNQDVEVTFVVPKLPQKMKTHVDLVNAEDYGMKITVKEIETLMMPYMTAEQYRKSYELFSKANSKEKSLYGKFLFEEVKRFAEAAKKIAKEVPHDVIHAHDWMTYEAGINASKVSGKPLLVHIHATEYDRSGDGAVNPVVHNLEKRGFKEADAIAAVSQFTKDKIMDKYDVPEKKVNVVHNAVEFPKDKVQSFKLSKKDKVVLFLGRITLQKGPDWFLEAAKKVLSKDPNVKFVMAGAGDMMPAMMEKAAEMGMARNVLWTGFLRGKDIDKAYKMADVYVMPSVSEPFGITPLEAMRNDTPVIISKQSGVSEVINHCLKVDFWDTQALADRMLSVLYYKDLKDELRIKGKKEVMKFSWDNPAKKVLTLYGQLIAKRGVIN